jgi:type I restriction enzyme S subunit
MRSNYRKIGSYIRLVDERDSYRKIKTLLGLTIDKSFIPSVANTIGSDMANYKIIRRGQFACSLMQVRRDKKIPVAYLGDLNEAIISQAYPVFEVSDQNKLLPEYLMMWMRRSEFDREACFYAVGGVRGSLEWEDFCNMELPVPSIQKQREIVQEYQTIVNRIHLNYQLNQKLEEAAQTIYKQWFVDFEFPISAEYAAAIGKPELENQPYKSSGCEMVFNEVLEQEIPKGWQVKPISNTISVKDGTHDSPQPVDLGKPLITSTHLGTYDVLLDDTYNISEEDFQDINKRSKVDQCDILMSMIGTVGNISYVLRDDINYAIKNIGLFKTSERKDLSAYIFMYLKSRAITKYIETCLLGSTQNYISLGELRNIPIFFPPSDILFNCTTSLDKIIRQAYLSTRDIHLCQSLIQIALGRMAQQNKEYE